MLLFCRTVLKLGLRSLSPRRATGMRLTCAPPVVIAQVYELESVLISSRRLDGTRSRRRADTAEGWKRKSP